MNKFFSRIYNLPRKYKILIIFCILLVTVLIILIPTVFIKFNKYGKYELPIIDTPIPSSSISKNNYLVILDFNNFCLADKINKQIYNIDYSKLPTNIDRIYTPTDKENILLPEIIMGSGIYVKNNEKILIKIKLDFIQNIIDQLSNMDIPFKFLGWCKNKNGSDTIYKPGDKFILNNSIVVLYAIWQDNRVPTMISEETLITCINNKL